MLKKPSVSFASLTTSLNAFRAEAGASGFAAGAPAGGIGACGGLIVGVAAGGVGAGAGAGPCARAGRLAPEDGGDGDADEFRRTSGVLHCFSSPVSANGHAAPEAVGQRRGDVDVDEPADEARVAGEIHDAIVLGARSQLAHILLGGTFDEHALAGPDHRVRVFCGELLQAALQALQARELFGGRGVVAQVGRGRAGRELNMKLNEPSKRTSSTSFSVCSKSASVSPGKPTMKSLVMETSGRAARSRRMIDLYSIACSRASSPRARGRIPDCTGRWICEASCGIFPCASMRRWVNSSGMRGRVADALDALDARHVREEQREIGDLAVGKRAPVGVHVLAEEARLAHAVARQVATSASTSVEGPRALPRRAYRGRRRSCSTCCSLP
jgi:hypothetical protein